MYVYVIYPEEGHHLLSQYNHSVNNLIVTMGLNKAVFLELRCRIATGPVESTTL